MDDLTFQHSSDALHYLENKIPLELRLPSVSVVCGSGLGGLAKTVSRLQRYPRCWIMLTRRSAWPRRKTIVWLAGCIESSDRSHVGKSSASETTFRQSLEDLTLYLESYYEGNSIK